MPPIPALPPTVLVSEKFDSVFRKFIALVIGIVFAFGVAKNYPVVEIVTFFTLFVLLAWSVASNWGQDFQQLAGLAREMFVCAMGVVIYFGWIDEQTAKQLLAAFFALAAAIWGYRDNGKKP